MLPATGDLAEWKINTIDSSVIATYGGLANASVTDIGAFQPLISIPCKALSTGRKGDLSTGMVPLGVIFDMVNSCSEAA